MRKRSWFYPICVTLLFALLAGVLVACGKVQFKLSFIVEGEVYATVDTNGEEVVRIPSDPTKEGAEFDGWFWDEGTWTRPFTANSLLDTPLTGNMSVYAKFRTENDVGNTELVMEGFKQIESEEVGKAFYISLANSRLVYSFQDIVKVDARSTWTLSSDIYGNNVITSKTVDLREGNNLFYILVTDQYGRSEQYTILLRRRPIFRVMFDTQGGSGCAAQDVEEGECCKEPTTFRTGYTFAGWNFDFDEPITSDTYITAQWTANAYRIHYDPNGGDLAETEQVVFYDGYVSLAVPDREGYIFSEWRMRDGTPYYGGFWGYTSDIWLMAAWTPKTYQVHYELQGGDFSFIQQQFYSTGMTSFTVENPKRAGYTFKGWWREGKFYPSNWSCMQIECTTGDITLTAEWEINTYHITLDAEGGECVEGLDVTYGDTFTLPTPARNGYTFGGWKYNGVSFESGTYDLTTDITITASWSPTKYSIQYSTEGGYFYSLKSEYTIEEEFSLGAPTKWGYTFLGWTKEGETVPVVDYSVPKGTYGDLNFTAHWKANEYKLSFDINGGEGEIPDMTVTYDAPYTLPDAARTGYDFVGWYYAEGREQQKLEDGVWQRVESYRLRAEWSARTDTPYLVRHYIEELEGGYTLRTEEHLQGTSDETVYIQPQTFSGFTLEWYRQNISGKLYRVEADGSLTVDIYYARDEYTLIFLENGGEEMANITLKYEAAFTVLPAVRSGFTFGGWFIDVGLTVPFEMTTMPAYSPTVYAWWKEETKADEFEYFMGSTSVVVEGYSGTDHKIIVPAYIGNLPVREIDNGVFSNKIEVTEVSVPDTVTQIAYDAFYKCDSLEKLTIPFVGRSISSSDTLGCIFGRGSYSSENGVHQGEHYYYSIPKTIRIVNVTKQTEIPAYAFENCNFIEHITIPEETTKIGASAFYGCSALSTLNSETEGEFNIPLGVKGIADSVFCRCTPMKKVKTGQLTQIADDAFFNCSELISFNSDREGEFIVPDTVTEMGSRAFYGCNNVETLTLPFVGRSIKYIGTLGYIFGSGSSSASGVVHQGQYYYLIPNTIRTVNVTKQTEIPEDAFENCNFIEHITIPEESAKIGASAFYGCSALSTLNSETEGEFNIPLGVKAIGSSTFYRCEKLTKVSLSDDASVADNAFNNTALTQKTGVIYLDKILYRYSGTMPSGYTLNIKPGTLSVLQNVFDGQTGLKKVIFPDGLKRIGQYAFRGCTSLEDISLPASVETIGKGAFAKCNGLKSVELPFAGTEAGEGKLTDIFETKPSALTSVTVLNGGAIPASAFSGYSTLEHIEFRGNITTVGNSAFSGCSGLTSLVLPGEVVSIGNRAFEKCTRLETFTVPAATRSLGDYVFDGCKLLGSVTFAAGSVLESIGTYAFRGCVALNAVELPTGVTAIGGYTFSGCSGLERVTLSENVRSIGQNAFENCKILRTIELPTGLLTIEAYAFRGCVALEEIVIPATVQTVGEYAFGGCSALQIECEAEALPDEWDYNWNPDNCPVTWNCV